MPNMRRKGRGRVSDFSGPAKLFLPQHARSTGHYQEITDDVFRLIIEPVKSQLKPFKLK